MTERAGSTAKSRGQCALRVSRRKPARGSIRVQGLGFGAGFQGLSIHMSLPRKMLMMLATLRRRPRYQGLVTLAYFDLGFGLVGLRVYEGVEFSNV